jgi:hypothetical protein
LLAAGTLITGSHGEEGRCGGEWIDDEEDRADSRNPLGEEGVQSSSILAHAAATHCVDSHDRLVLSQECASRALQITAFPDLLRGFAYRSMALTLGPSRSTIECRHHSISTRCECQHPGEYNTGTHTSDSD